MATFKGFAMKKLNETGWVEKEVPECGPLDAIIKPTCVSPCTSDIHTVWEGAIGDRKDMVLGHEAVGEVVEVGNLVQNFKPGDKVIIPAITSRPDASCPNATTSKGPAPRFLMRSSNPHVETVILRNPIFNPLLSCKISIAFNNCS